VRIRYKNKYPKGWNEAQIRRVIDYYDSQTADEEAAEIEASLARTTMEVPVALVPVVRELIAKRKSARARKPKTPKRRIGTNKSRAA
jgi:hypothetical protein